MKSKKLTKTLEEIAERHFNAFLSDEDWMNSTEYLYYQIYLLESQNKKLVEEIIKIKSLKEHFNKLKI